MNATWQDPSLTGVFIRLLWSELQKAPGTADSSFDFMVLDREMNQAVKNGKVFSLSIKAGDDGTPLWLFTNGVTALSLQDSGSDGEAARPALLQSAEPFPDIVVQRTLHMTRDDRVPPVQYVSRVRHRRTLFARRDAESRARGCNARRPRPPRTG